MKKTTNLEIYELILKMQNNIGNDLNSMKDDIKTLDKKIDTVEYNLNQKIDAKNDIAKQVSDEIFDIYNEFSITNNKLDHLINYAKTQGYVSVREEDVKYDV